MSLYSRHSWVRAALEKHQQDRQFLENFNPESWYRVHLDQITRSDLRSSFVQLQYDDESRDFVTSSMNLSNHIGLQLCYSFLSFFLQYFVTKTSLNGLLGRGSMFVFSSAQLLQLLPFQARNGHAGAVSPQQFHQVSSSCASHRYEPHSSSCAMLGEKRKLVFLDIGAGDGKVTEKLQVFNAELHATEMSSVMQWRLKGKGIAVVGLDEWKSNLHVPYDLILLLNVVDRHARPLSLLREIRERLLRVDGALLLLAVVLPFSQYVEYRADHMPEERLYVRGDTFEAQAESFVGAVLEPAGFRVLSWSKVPYLCEGDMYKSLYTLTDALFLVIPS